MFSMQIGIGMPMGGNILQRSMGMAGGFSMGVMSGPQGTMAFAGLFGQDQVGFSPDAMMGQGPSCFNHPLMNNGFGMPMCGFNNGMGMIPGMNPGMNQMGGQNNPMMLMMMQMLMMMMQMMQQQGMGGMQNGMGMPNFGNPLNMGMPGCGGCGGGMPNFGNPINMAPPYGHSNPLPPFAAGNPSTGPNMGAQAANPNVQIPNFGPNPSKQQVNQMLEAASQKYGIPANILKGVAWQESGWRANASSFDGGHGKGIMQIDDRFHQFARTNEVWDPVKNIDYGANYLKSLYNKTGDWSAALKRYNGGSSYPPKIMAHAQNQPWQRYLG